MDDSLPDQQDRPEKVLRALAKKAWSQATACQEQASLWEAVGDVDMVYFWDRNADLHIAMAKAMEAGFLAIEKAHE